MVGLVNPACSNFLTFVTTFYLNVFGKWDDKVICYIDDRRTAADFPENHHLYI